MFKSRIPISFFLLCILRKSEIHDAAATNPGNSKVCQTPECKNAASTILQSIDPKVEPCDDFYGFACGNFLKTTEIPKNKTSINRIDTIQEKVHEQLKSVVVEPIQPNEPKFITLSKNFYKACMDTMTIEKNGVRTVLAKLKEAGGWPLLEGDNWIEKNFHWELKPFDMQKLGYNSDYFFTTGVLLIGGPSSQNIVSHIGEPQLSPERGVLLKGFNDKIVTAYYKYMVDTAVILGATRPRAEKELREVLEFQIQLAKICDNQPFGIILDNPNNMMTIGELKKEYQSIPWDEYFNNMPNLTSVKFADDHMIQVNSPDFFKNLGKLMEQTPKRVLANYLFWRVVQESAPFLSEKIANRQMEFKNLNSPSTNEKKDRCDVCLDLTSDSLGGSIGALYGRKYFNGTSQKLLEEILGDMKEQLRKTLTEADWMDAKSRASALDKFKSLNFVLTILNSQFDEEHISKHYKTVEIAPDDFLQAYLNASLASSNMDFGGVEKPENRQDFHLSIGVAIETLQDLIFNKDRPQYLNYAGVGPFNVGNEITRPFDGDGSKIDRHGDPKDWWTPETRGKFLKKAACITEQYRNFTVKDGGVKSDENQATVVNIADNQGVKMAYLAYQDWVKRHGPEPTLPGLNYSQSQLFWIQTALTQCVKYTPKFLQNINNKGGIEDECNIPSEFRVTGLFANRPEFGTDFKCPVGSKMNPVKKCNVW